MHQIYPDDGLLYVLNLLAEDTGSGFYWRLFESNTTPTLDDVVGDFTLSNTSWGRLHVDAADFTLQQVFTHIGSIQAPNIVFTNTTGSTKTIYGYLILNTAEDKIIGAARFDSAPLTVLNGGTVVVTPILGALSNLTS